MSLVACVDTTDESDAQAVDDTEIAEIIAGEEFTSGDYVWEVCSVIAECQGGFYEECSEYVNTKPYHCVKIVLEFEHAALVHDCEYAVKMPIDREPDTAGECGL
jgi:hypothetical protein